MFNETKGDVDSQYIENNCKRELEKNNFSLENNFNSNEYNNSLKDGLSPYKKIDENVILNGNFENKRDGLKNLDSDNISPNKEISQNNKIDKDAILDSNLEKHDSESPVIEIKCRNEELEGKKHPETGVPFERKTVQDANGNDVEVVVPKFESEFDIKLPENLEQESDKKQFDYCNEKLEEEVNKNPDFESKFDKEQLEQIHNRDTPDGCTWHHDAEKGKMQLVDSEIHAKTGHTGGKTIWGGGNDNR